MGRYRHGLVGDPPAPRRPIDWTACLKPAKELAEIEVGYALVAAVWRRGYGREALEAVVGYGRKERGLRRVIATVRPENIGLRALLEACGFVREPDLFIHAKTLCLYAHTGA